MAAHPYWSGQIRISLVTLAVNIFTATRRESQIPLHELDRKTGERIRHQNVNDDGDPVENEDIVKGYEYEKNEYVLLEKEEIEGVKLPSSDTLELNEFVTVEDIPIMHFERPYYVLPEKKADAEIYTVLNEALGSSGKAGIGQIALRGREELCAVMAFENGLILETLRYDAELSDPSEFFSGLERHAAKRDYIALAKQLIEQNTHPLKLDRFHDHYHEALKELIEAKKHHRKPRYAKPVEKPGKVVDFMDALQRSLKAGGGRSSTSRKSA